jgi:hypothetical protein
MHLPRTTLRERLVRYGIFNALFFGGVLLLGLASAPSVVLIAYIVAVWAWWMYLGVWRKSR